MPATRRGKTFRGQDRESKQPMLKPEVVRGENNRSILERREKQLTDSKTVRILTAPLRTPSNVPCLPRRQRVGRRSTSTTLSSVRLGCGAQRGPRSAWPRSGAPLFTSTRGKDPWNPLVRTSALFIALLPEGQRQSPIDLNGVTTQGDLDASLVEKCHAYDS